MDCDLYGLSYVVVFSILSGVMQRISVTKYLFCTVRNPFAPEVRVISFEPAARFDSLTTLEVLKIWLKR